MNLFEVDLIGGHLRPSAVSIVFLRSVKERPPAICT